MKIKIDTNINAPVEKVWAAYTRPEDITKWNFASDQWCCPSVENQLFSGGTYKARMEAKDKSSGFDFTAVYDEIIKHRKIRYTISDGRKVEVLFHNTDGKTDIQLLFDAETENPVELQRLGWQAILNNFKGYVESISG